MAGGEGFEPSTPNLGGWCSIREQFKSKREPPFTVDCPIRTELLAHDKAKVNLAKQIPIDQLLKIERVVIYLEGKGKQPNTIDSFRRHIAVLARHANLQPPRSRISNSETETHRPHDQEANRQTSIKHIQSQVMFHLPALR